MTGCIMYTTDKNRYIDKLCVSGIDLTKIAIFIPHIGETFIDRNSNVEYEVKDIIRALDGDEYIVQIHLHERSKRKYNR